MALRVELTSLSASIIKETTSFVNGCVLHADVKSWKHKNAQVMPSKDMEPQGGCVSQELE